MLIGTNQISYAGLEMYCDAITKGKQHYHLKAFGKVIVIDCFKIQIELSNSNEDLNRQTGKFKVFVRFQVAPPAKKLLVFFDYVIHIGTSFVAYRYYATLLNE